MKTVIPYRADIDGLRAVAIALVVGYHVQVGVMRGGFIGVDIFFVISGFLITAIITAERGRGSFSFLHFYARRVRRLFPALMAALAASSLAAYVILFPPELEAFGRSLAAAVLFVANFHFMAGEGYFAEEAGLLPLHHTWSLAVEEQFYLLYPALLLLVLRLPRRFALSLLAVGALASFALSLRWTTTWQPAAFYLLPARAWELLLGALLALGAIPAAPRIWRELAGAAGMVMLVIGAAAISRRAPFPGWNALVPCLGAALIIWSGSGRDTFVYRLLSLRWLVLLGLASYSIYVWHMPLIALFRAYYGVSLHNGQKAALALASVGLGALSYRFIEGPIRFGGVLASRKALFAAAGASIALMLGVAAIFVAGKGFPERFSPQARRFADYRYAAIIARGNPLNQGPAGPGCFVDGDARLAPECLLPRPGPGNILLIGDSHAAHLSEAIGRLWPDLHVLQATAGGCKPILEAKQKPARCREVVENTLLEAAPKLPVEAIVIAANWNSKHLPGLVAAVRALKPLGHRIIVIGPVPTYIDSLPRILARAIAADDPAVIRRGRDTDRFGLDEAMAKAMAAEGIDYISMIGAMCDQARDCVTLDEAGDPIQYDYGHFTAAGAELVLGKLKKSGRLSLP